MTEGFMTEELMSEELMVEELMVKEFTFDDIGLDYWSVYCSGRPKEFRPKPKEGV